MVALSAIGSQQVSSTVDTYASADQHIYYIATYPHESITYRASDMILDAHSGASYLNKHLSRIRAGSQIFLSENDPLPAFNGPVFTIITIIKFIMSSSAEYELGALFITSK